MLVADANGAQHVKNAISNKYKCLFKYVVLRLGPVPVLVPVDVGVDGVQQLPLLVLCGLLILLIRRFAASIANVFVGALASRWFNGIEHAAVVVADTAFDVDFVACVCVACAAMSCASVDVDNNATPDNGSFSIDEAGNISATPMPPFPTVGRVPFGWSFGIFIHFKLFIVSKYPHGSSQSFIMERGSDVASSPMSGPLLLLTEGLASDSIPFKYGC